MIDIIGQIYTPGVYGEPDPESGRPVETVPPLPLDGWHVNITPAVLADRPDLAPFVVMPSALRRVWSGDDPLNPTQTVALRFADEYEALTYFPA